MMSNVLTVVSKSLRGAITCVKLDADKYPGLASRYKIKALPTLVLFKVRSSRRCHLHGTRSQICPRTYICCFMEYRCSSAPELRI